MQLTERQTAMLNGEQGETMQKVMQTLVMYGECFEAEKMVDVTSDYGHLVTSFGLSVMTPIYELMDQLIEADAVSQQQFSVDPRPMDPAVPQNLLEKLVFKIMYGKQDEYEAQLKELGLKDKNAFTCTMYMDEVGNTPKKGDILSWAESSAVVFANSVLGARCNRNSGIIELFGSIAGCVPYFGLLTDEGRKADWIAEVKTDKLPEAQLLGSAIGIKVVEDIPYIKGLDKFLGTELTDEVKDYLKDMGAATASNGAVGLYHIENLTPEAKELGDNLLKENVKTYVIDDAEIQRVKDSYPVIWKNPDAKPKLCFVGCPHLSAGQIEDWYAKLKDALAANGKDKITIPTVFTTAPDVKADVEARGLVAKLNDLGVIVSSICPLMYMNNPLCAKKPVITCSNKLRTYSSARYYTEDEITALITGGDI